MKRKIDLIVANPAGNTTLLVLTPTDRKDYQEISDKLLSIDYGRKFDISFGTPGSLFGEQVAFVLPAGSELNDSYAGKSNYHDENVLNTDCINASDTNAEIASSRKLPALEMSGLEFCGNASRAFAYYLVLKNQTALRENINADVYNKSGSDAAQQKITNAAQKSCPTDSVPVKTVISVSGCDHPITAYVDLKNKSVEVEMPVPAEMTYYSAHALELDDNECASGGVLVKLDGISHLILEDVKPSHEMFNRLKNTIYSKFRKPLPAFGVMFVDRKSNEMIPFVYVHDIDTTYLEGSCASGTTAASCAFTAKAADGVYEYTFSQPSGTLYTKAVKENGKIQSINLKGLLELSDVISVEI